MDKLISSLLAFILALIPISSPQTVSPPINQASILFTGDVMLGRSVMGEALDQNDNLYPFRKVTNFLQDADITYVNLENPITKDCKRHVGGFTFCTTPEIAEGLKESGVDIVSLANNHSGNYGVRGLEETKNYLDQMGIGWVDGTNLEIIEKNGTKFGFLGFDLVFKDFTNKNQELITSSDPLVDILIIVPHWGEEYKAVASSMQQVVSKKMIEAGADVIIGAHPHWVQNYEEYQGKPIYYSLGNFVFDQMWSEETKKGLVVKMTFENNEVIKRAEFKTYIKTIGQSEIVE